MGCTRLAMKYRCWGRIHLDPFSIKLAMYIQVCLVVYYSIRRTQLGYPNSSVKAPLRPRKIIATTKIPPVKSHECQMLAALPNTTSKDCTHGCDQDRNLSKDCRLIKLWSSFHHESMKMQFQWAPMPSYDAARLRCPVVRTSGLWQRLLACSNWATELNSLGKCQFRMVKTMKIPFGCSLGFLCSLPHEVRRSLQSTTGFRFILAIQVCPSAFHAAVTQRFKTTQRTICRMMSIDVVYHMCPCPHSPPKINPSFE